MANLDQEDLNAIRTLVREEVKDVLEDELEGRLRFLPTKEELFSRMDELLTMMRNVRDELVALTQRVRRSEDRIEVLEELHPEGQHTQD